ncbi:FecR family protein [Algoriphagus aquimarinus]|uniref:Ferric-dicitrate binding protein FerR, regulates iron transport through sigma-19 n=1 Tax=Algoriphagus aquimarinus TaxID=237018 RepID=A0A1I1BQ99_9BACT|nr:FecR domain-containing protein [Algoriphagus aquimarinus]SFB52307.1 ferric-dicitrate binding protein FerR, regulates iron transport through sigma-19 [Algoriphagus aquimarinus]
MDSELLKRFFEGKCDPHEVHQILVWINSQEGGHDIEDAYLNFKDDKKLDPIVSDLVLERIHKELKLEEDGNRKGSLSKKKKVISNDKRRGAFDKNWFKLGVAAVLVFGFVLTVYWTDNRLGLEEKVAVVSQVEYIIREVGPGQKLTLKLTDGSVVILNSNSQLKFPKNFDGATRDVYLEGEAFFDVYRDELKPFVVHSKFVETSVLGTSFVVNENLLAGKVQVSVLTGKVRVTEQENFGKDRKVVLAPMDAVRFNDKTGAFETKKVGYDEVFAWKDNVLFFDNTQFSEVVIELENWFGVKIDVQKNIKNRKDYSGRFDNESLEMILTGLAFTYGFEFEIISNKVIIY